MDSAMADCGDDGMSGEDTQCPHCARLKLERRGLRLKLERYRKESDKKPLYTFCVNELPRETLGLDHRKVCRWIEELQSPAQLEHLPVFEAAEEALKPYGSAAASGDVL